MLSSSCQNDDCCPCPTSMNSNIRMLMNTTSGLGLGLLSQTLCVTVDLGLSQCYRSSPHVSARSFMTLVKFTWSVSSLISVLKGSVQRTRTCSLCCAHKLALHSVCSCFQGGMCSGCCCLCVLSSAGVSACCLCLFFFPLAEDCSKMSHQRWVCKETTKQVLPQSSVVPLGDF